VHLLADDLSRTGDLEGGEFQTIASNETFSVTLLFMNNNENHIPFSGQVKQDIPRMFVLYSLNSWRAAKASMRT
jgi:hypothetical protein